MRGAKDSRPDYHRRLAWYHFRKWLFPDSKIPIPEEKMSTVFYKAELEPGGFLTDLFLKVHDVPIRERPYELLRPLRYFSEEVAKVIEAPQGYRTDFASVPRIFWRIIPPFGRYHRAAVIHDYLCELAGSTGVDSKTAAKIFHEAMLIAGVNRVKASTMYYMVRWFGPRFKANLVV